MGLGWIAEQLRLPTDQRLKLPPPSAISSDPELMRELGGCIADLYAQAHQELPSELEQCSPIWLSNIATHLARSKTLADAWPDDVSPPLLIKGSDLEQCVYPRFGLSVGARSSTDWDLLLPHPEYGYLVQQWANRYDPPTLPTSVRLTDEPSHELGFSIEGLLFEIHRDPAPRYACLLSGAELWSRGIPITLTEGLTVRHPSPLDRLWIWLTHYAKSGGITRLIDWLDFTFILSDLEAGFSALPTLALRFGLKSAFTEAMCRWSHSPLSILIPSLDRWIKVRYQAPLDRFTFMNRLRHHAHIHEIRIAQLRLVPPPLRAQYLGRGVLHLLNPSPTKKAKEDA